ncbi:YciI family protein [Saccharothrix sp. Mg75]|uniref:YciI family protein n=1 Tax=Saccharothrix sp. Mg75 TaxID=3445357 RepID=UPI003EEC812C
MYVVLLEYTAPVDEVDLALPDHVKWVEEQYEAGHFLASGRQVPRVGGVVLVRPMPREDLDALLATDPFATRELVAYRVVEFVATRTAPELAALTETA